MWFDSNSGSPRMTFQEACDLGFLTDSDVVFLKRINHGREGKMVCSPEFIQDSEIRLRSMFKIRTDPISDVEIEEWKQANKQLNEMDWEAARERVKIDEQDKPYDTDDWLGPLDWTERM